MPWKVVERKIGRAGGVKQRTARQRGAARTGNGKPHRDTSPKRQRAAQVDPVHPNCPSFALHPTTPTGCAVEGATVAA